MSFTRTVASNRATYMAMRPPQGNPHYNRERKSRGIGKRAPEFGVGYANANCRRFSKKNTSQISPKRAISCKKNPFLCPFPDPSPVDHTPRTEPSVLDPPFLPS